MSAAFARRVRGAMRAQGVTIRELAAAMSIPMTRVRQVRKFGSAPEGTPPGWTSWHADWLEGIRYAAEQRRGST